MTDEKDLREYLHARKRFYDGRPDDIARFVDSIMVLARGHELGTTIQVENMTPEDMDGIVLKVTIT